tara:strand:- start:10940 stop:11782 length:843 start_codon:yes stop_codon:yes gene_type:complete
MTLRDYKLKMISDLSSIYEIDELNSIFNLLSEEYLKIPRSKILFSNNIYLDNKMQNIFFNSLKRLKKYEPIQYVLGKTSFMNLDFKVNNKVLIPRPETEELVRLILKENLNGKEILDIGTGSGCIAISLAKNFPEAKVTSLDISEDALDVAMENAKLNNVKINFIKADIFNYFSDKKFDIIVSNPPYILKSEKSLMKQNVLNYEPHLALFVNDNNPNKFYKKILDFSLTSLNSRGKIFFEFNNNQFEQLKIILNNYEYFKVNFHNDFKAFNRFMSINLLY